MDYGPIFDDDGSNVGLLEIDGRNNGYEGMREPGVELSYGAFEDFHVPLIPESDWDAIIREQEAAGVTIKQLCEEMSSPPKNQGSIPYCWVFAPTHCCELIRLQQTGQVVSYSPASCGAPVKGFRRVGGWGSQALERMKVFGVNESTDWPDTAISRRFFTDENKRKAKRNIALEYVADLNWQQRGSLILAGIPTADGYPWWRHEVCGVGIVPGSHDLVIRNSWGNWGDGNGFGVLSGRKKHAGDSVAITSLRPI